MIYKVSDIARDVRVALDQNTSSVPLAMAGDVDTLSLEDIVRSKIVEGVFRVEMAAPVHLLEGGHHFGDAVYWGEHACGWILLPDDFMRLVSFRMSDWARAVHSAMSSTDVRYGRLSSRYKGIRGTAQRPVCAIAMRAGGRVLEFYSCRSTAATVAEAVYLPYPAIDEYGGVDICERCYKAVVYMVAGLVLSSCGDGDGASAMFELSKSLIN